MFRLDKYGAPYRDNSRTEITGNTIAEGNNPYLHYSIDTEEKKKTSNKINVDKLAKSLIQGIY